MIASRLSTRRALPRAVHGRIALTAISSSIQPFAATRWSTQWLRYKSNRSNRPVHLNPRSLDYEPNRSARPVASAAQDSTRQDRSVKESAEFDTTAIPSRNTIPSSQPGPGSLDNLSKAPKEGADFNEIQEEFNSPQNPKVNTEPSSQSSEPISESEPTGPLPDLRQGIPSTFAQEFLNKKAKAQTREHAHHHVNVTEDPRKSSNQGEEAPEREQGELPKSAFQTSIDKRREKFARWMYLGFAAFATTGAIYVGRNWETEEEERAHPDAPSGWGFQLFYDRVWARLSGQMGYYTEPTFTKLLPDVEPAPPYTLLLSLEDLMIHSEWSREHGWRTAKRPGIDYFLGYMSQYFELVLFTSLPVSQADPIVRKLDPYHFMTFPLFREATRYENGSYVKDLSYINRPLSKTLIIDTKPEHVKAQPENAIILKPWTGDPKDKDLVNLIPFLEHVAAMGITDVRDAVKSFQGRHIPTEFARREAIAREEFQKQLAEEQAKKPKRGGLGFLGGALGMKPQGGMSYDGTTSVSEELARGKMLADQIRERGIKQYEILEKEIRENGEKWLREEKEMEKKMMEEQMRSMKKGFIPFLGAGVDEK